MPQNYRALTRTYRPQTFDDIVSQEHVSNTLINAIKQDRLSHAYMFCGPRGVGKTTMARVLARTINSIDADVDAESLNQTLNVVEIDAASNNKVDDIHHLRESVRIPPQNGRYKVFIVDEVHMLSKAAFNALLKTLEEPPAHAIFIFATTEPHKVLPTILSRVQRFDFKRISVDEIVDRLKAICQKEGITIDDESLHVIAKKADGALRDALGLMDQAIAFCGDDIHHNELIEALNVVGVDQLFSFISSVENKDSGTGLQLVDDMMKAGVDIQEFLSALTEHLRNLYVALNSGRMHLVDATPDTKARYKEAAKAFEEEDLMRMLHLVSDAQLKIRDVQQPRVHFEILLLKLIHMNRSRELNSLIEDLNQLKKNGRIQLTDKSSESSGSVEKEPEASVSAEPQRETEPEPESESGSPNSADHSETASINQPESEPPHTGNGSLNQMSMMREEPGEEAPSTPSNRDKTEDQLSEEPEPEQPADEASNKEATESQVSEAVEDEEDDDDFLMIKPTLGYAEGISSPQGVIEQKADTETAVEQEYPEPVTLNSVDDLDQYWRSFVDKVKNNAPRMLYMQVLRVTLKQLRGTELVVAADTEFATNLFDANQPLLSELMKRTVGVRIRIKCIVERNEKKKETKSPYERFKELQKKDPHLKTVVELFGAELDY
ncbi:DNA polymerase III subunit gamma/tau [Rhodohalobacter sp. 8-1]|uniref:DNA polymerase III subunit gamma/tau n=1 Tax=Rhodohalobacter sp. 8-1 TaxID=3131972 RepID=UPI0030EEDFE6